MAPPTGSLYARGFAADAETERALRAGLAGRETRVRRGRLEAAVRALVTEPSSRLVFVDLDGAPDPEAAARELASVCSFETVLIAIGSTDTADLARALLRQGVADYLVKPISAAAVREAGAKALDDLPERTYAGRVIAFAGTAGSGVSTLVAAIARGVAADGRAAIVVDLDPIAGTLATLLDAEPAGDLEGLLEGLQDALAGEEAPPPDEEEDSGEPDGLAPSIEPERLDAVCARGDAGVSLVAYPPSGPLPASASPAALHALLAHLANRAHVVGVTGVFDPELRTEIMNRADARDAQAHRGEAQHQRGGALPRPPRPGAADHPGAMPSPDAQEHPLPGPDPLRARRTAPGRGHPLRADPARGGHRGQAAPGARQGVPRGPPPGGRARGRRSGRHRLLTPPPRPRHAFELRRRRGYNSGHGRTGREVRDGGRGEVRGGGRKPPEGTSMFDESARGTGVPRLPADAPPLRRGRQLQRPLRVLGRGHRRRSRQEHVPGLGSIRIHRRQRRRVRPAHDCEGRQGRPGTTRRDSRSSTQRR